MASLTELLEGASSEVLENLEEVTTKYITLEGLIPTVTDLLKDQAAEIRLYNKELGTGSKTSSKFRGELAKISSEIGVSVREQLELVSVTKQYHQGIQDTTKATLNFVRASGVSIDTIGELSATMTVMGNTSEKSFTEMYEGILSVRDALGLTADQINITANILTRYNVIMQANEQRMVSAGKSAAKFVSTLTSVGIKGDEVSDILDKLIDPNKLTDNIALLSKMGLTVSDLVSGDPLEKLDSATERLRDIGKEITNIAKVNRFQANELAKVYGLTLDQAIRLSELDTSNVGLDTKKSLEQYRNEVSTLTQTLTDFKTVITGGLVQGISWVGNIVEKLTNTLDRQSRAIKTIVAIWLGKKLFTGLTNVFGKAAKKFGKDFGEGFSDYLKQVEARDKSKVAEMSGLVPKKESEQNIDYGWGKNYELAALKRRQEFDRKKYKTENPNITSGEILENVQEHAREINSLKKTRAQLESTGQTEELKLFDERFGKVISGFDETFKGLIDKIYEVDKKWENSRIKGSSENLIKENSRLNQTNFVGSFESMARETGLGSLEQYGLNGKEQKAAELVNISSGPKEFLENLIEFWKLSDDPKAAEYIEAAGKSLKDLRDNAITAAGGVDELKKATKDLDYALEQSSKNIKGRFTSLLKGLLTDVGTKIKSIFNPKTMIYGGLGAITALLAKSEKGQQAIAKFNENIITPAIETLTNIITPVIEGIAKAINWITDFFAPKLSKITSKINNSVSTIESSYKKEDLKQMMLASGVDYKRDEDKLIAILGEAVYEIKGISKKQDESNDNALARAQFATT